ncbi:esterase-like activity of phytase family protein [Azospirillum sp. B4]|uniref:esterase-like activity of phytase family protein n=1 Tax=Azospirillum sp. B4 TaxID=95605 RepID=UPI00034DF2B7|nr:esterase-like activity of phytase family protein [Azospirillum sp. B4]
MRNLFRKLLLGTTLIGLPLPAVAQSAVDVTLNGTVFTNQGLQGVGRLPASLKDKFGETFGSISSMQIDLHTWHRLADGSYAGTLYTLPDRGYNVASTTNYIPRYNILDLTFSPYTGTTPAAQNQIGLSLRDTIQFKDNAGTPFSGLDPGAGGATNTFRAASGTFPNLPQAPNGRLALDPEGFAFNRDGTIWISDEYGPYIYRFNRDGTLLSVIRPPEALVPKRNGGDNFAAAEGPTLPIVGTNPQTGRQDNQGLEGLSLSPDGKTLFTVLQSAAVQDLDPASVNTSRRNTRLLSYDISNPTSAVLKGEWVVQLPMYNNNGNPAGALNRVAAESELLALNNTQFLLLSRDGNGYGSGATPNSSPTSYYRRIDLLDITGATNIAGTAYDTPGTPIAPKGVLTASITPVQFASFVDVNNAAQLAKFGLVNGATNNVNCHSQCLSEKWEALALVPALDRAHLDDFFLFLGNDNDFVTQKGYQVGSAYADASGVENDTTLLAYRLTLPTYVDPLATESQQLTAGPLGQALGETALSSQRSAARDVTGRTQAARAGFAERTEGSTQIAAGGDWASAGDPGADGRVSRPRTWSVGVTADYAITSTVRAGLGFGYADDKAKFGPLGKADGQSWALGPYLSVVMPGGFYLDASYRHVDVTLKDIRRTTFAYDLTATGSTSGQGDNVSVEVGQVFTAGDLRFGPIASLTYDRISLDRWSEDNALHLNLDHPDQTMHQMLGSLGGFISTRLDLGGVIAVPELSGAYQARIGSDGRRDYTTVLSNRRASPLGIQTATLPGVEGDGWRVGTGLTLALTPSVAFLINGDASFLDHDKPAYGVGAAFRFTL